MSPRACHPLFSRFRASIWRELANIGAIFILGVALPSLRLKPHPLFTISRHLSALISRRRWVTRSRRVLWFSYSFSFGLALAATILAPAFADNVPQAINGDSRLSVGLILPLTGPTTELGTAFQNGISLAQERNPDISSIINVHFLNSTIDSDSILENVERFKIEKDLNFLITVGCEVSKTVLPLASKLDIPVAFFCPQHSMSTPASMTFGLTPPVERWGEAMWSYLRKQGYKKMCVVQSRSSILMADYSALHQAVTSSLLSSELFLIEEFSKDSTDFRPAISAMKKKGCDAVGVYLQVDQIKNFYRQMAELRFRVPAFGTNVYDSSDLLRTAGADVEGAVFVDLDYSEDFRTKFIRKFGHELNLASACVVHDIMNLLFELVRTRGVPPTSIELFERIYGAQSAPNACNHGTFVKTADGAQFMGYRLVLKKISRGRATRLGMGILN